MNYAEFPKHLNYLGRRYLRLGSHGGTEFNCGLPPVEVMHKLLAGATQELRTIERSQRSPAEKARLITHVGINLQASLDAWQAGLVPDAIKAEG